MAQTFANFIEKQNTAASVQRNGATMKGKKEMVDYGRQTTVGTMREPSNRSRQKRRPPRNVKKLFPLKKPPTISPGD